MFTKVLVANRAEIASRVIRTCKRLGVATVAVYSDADAALPYVAEADESVCIGPPEPSQSYLDARAIMDAARATGAQAIHPGYGFLSEQAAFARAVADAGLVFIGPTPQSMEQLGSKTAAKAVAEKAGVPVVPWFAVEDDCGAGVPPASGCGAGLWPASGAGKTSGEDAGGTPAPQTEARAIERAAKIGYPVIVKPAAGGGGKGMYRCDNADELRERMTRAAREAKAAFGDERLLVEKFLVNPRHIEVQILADSHGKVLHLFERECSIQRRNQKLIEESPSVAIDGAQRARICADAVRIAAAAGYTNAGTCEFLYDEAAVRWYFCEMNTRLQVEHPVTEMVTGLDLVEQQLRVAAGERLALEQSSIEQRGHAIEFRVIAEDPFENFAPSLGMIEHFRAPDGEGVRNETGFAAGCTVTQHYDSLLAKLIVHGADRQEAVDRGAAALLTFEIAGVRTCLAFHLAMLGDDGFLGGDFHIHYAEQRLKDGLLIKDNPEVAALAAAFMAWRRDSKTVAAHRRADTRRLAPWTSSALPR